MIICCDNGESSWMYKDYYMIDQESLEELQEYAKNNLPISALEIQINDERFIFTDEDVSKQKLIYLNQYKRVYESWPEFLTYEYLKELTEKQCKKCIYWEYKGSGYYRCSYIYSPDSFKNCNCFIEKNNIIYKIFKCFKRQ